MATYLNPGKYAYEEAVRSAVFVDKTPMIRYLNSLVRTRDKYACVSRPRRFGKTMAVDMLSAYYGRGAGSRKLFQQTRLATDEPSGEGGDALPWDTYLGSFDVLRIVMTDFFTEGTSVKDAIVRLRQLVARDVVREYPDASYFDKGDLSQSMADAFAVSGRQFVVLIDEWDAPFRVRKADAAGQRAYLDFLRGLLKDKGYVALAYMTGILPIKKYGQHSALNMFDEYSMTQPQQLAEYVGFTAAEVRALCDDRGLRFEGMREWYDGYRLSNRPSADLLAAGEVGAGLGGADKSRVYEVYSPLSVVRAARSGRLANYWSRTETYEALAEYIRMDFDGLRESVALLMDGGRMAVDTSAYQNDMTTFRSRDDVLSLLVHLGYLGYDDETREVFVPNREILDEFRTSTSGDDWSGAFYEYESSKKLLKATLALNEGEVARLLEAAHDRAGNMTYHDEAALSYAIRLAYYAAQKHYTTVVELDSGKGYADVVYLPSPRRTDLPALLVELKYQKDANTALEQIKRKEYPSRLAHYKGNMLLVGISYDRNARSDTAGYKRHSCRIERA
ncbi:MAG: AAA family ATPase [Coriobacteriales bacterium]|nr:AAA family ATPase [Coriobacteriales bacterium]